MSVSCRAFVFLALSNSFLASRPAIASTLTIGPDGINSSNLTLADGLTPLDGDGIAIGQVEPGRPAMMGVDAANTLHASVNPTAVFRQDGGATVADLNNAVESSHAMRVAGILISNDATARGVATGASLYASAHLTGPGSLGTLDDETMRTVQHIATQPNMRAVNHSYRKVVAMGVQPDGNDLLSAGFDWSASEHNVLHVTSGNNAGSPAFSPKANFNGMVVGRSARVGNTGKYRAYDGGNLNIPLSGSRTAIDILAPGFDVQSTLPNNMLTPPVPQSPDDVIDNGASFAAPHVTGTVALLQQFGDDRAGATNWTGSVASGPTSQRHEVMKAVLMNSADKVTGVLGMERIVTKRNGDNWFSTDASMQQFTPLDVELGTGHLNANRALAQFAPGEHEPGVSTTVLNRAWDYSTSPGPNTETRYRLADPLAVGDHVQVTLAWDRIVEFDNSSNGDNVFDVGEEFESYTDIEEVLSDLDVFIVARDADISSQLEGSNSTEFSVEHFLYEVDTAGLYDIVIDHTLDFFFNSLGSQDYAIAWWAGPDTVITNPLAADFDNDGDVDGDDLMDWENDFATGTGGDADNDGDTDGADFLAWQHQFTGPGPLASAATVPEPGACMLLALGLPALHTRRTFTPRQ